MAIRFLYFDLGNVLLNFSHKRACDQMGAVTGVTADKVWEVLFESGLERRYESGQIDDDGFYEEFCSAVGSRPDFQALLQAGSDIFEVNGPIIPLLAQLRAAGHRIGILSNTCRAHWTYCWSRRYGMLHQIPEVYALSYEIGCTKPDERIFRSAAELAGVAPEEIFFTDDIPSHIESARNVGFDAVLFTDVPSLTAELDQRGIRSNY